MAENQSNVVENGGIKITIKSNESEKELHVVMKRNMKIRTVLHGFCEHASLDYRSTRFVLHHDFHRGQFSHDKTAKQLGLEDGDQIDALTDGNGA